MGFGSNPIYGAGYKEGARDLDEAQARAETAERKLAEAEERRLYWMEKWQDAIYDCDELIADRDNLQSKLAEVEKERDELMPESNERLVRLTTDEIEALLCLPSTDNFEERQMKQARGWAKLRAAQSGNQEDEGK